MTFDQSASFILLAGALILFAWGRWRYDVVAFMALLAAMLLGLVPLDEAFLGFGHPATVTVALVLIIGRGLSNSGAIDILAEQVSPTTSNPSLHVAGSGGLGAALSAVMNNVGALALLMPVSVQSALKAKLSPAVVLMPLSFATILGGLVTLIGTPPNIIIATYRTGVVGAPFSMFDFTPVGATVAAVGVLFVAFVGWRLIPKQRRARLLAEELFDIENYMTEARVPESSRAVGMTVREIGHETGEVDAAVVGLIRKDRRILGPLPQVPVQAEDLLLIEAGPEAMDKFAHMFGLELAGTDRTRASLLQSDDVSLIEAVVPPGSRIDRRAVNELRLRTRYGVNLLAVSRQGRPRRDRLRTFRFQQGDVLLLQGDTERLPEVLAELGCLPLAARGLQVGKRGQASLSVGLFAAAITAAAAGVLSLQIALGLVALTMVLLRIIAPREIYDSVDWPVIVLLGALIPVGAALENTGSTQLIAAAILKSTTGASPVTALVAVMVVTIALSSVLNNAAAALVTAPIAVGVADELAVSPDPFLMAVAIGASCAFLTPIGHQNNALIMGPGGYRFGDYWRMGLPLEVLVVIVAVPMILWVWPL